MQDKLIKKIILMVGIIAVLGVASSSVVLSSPASAQKGPGEEQVIGVFGKIPGKDLIVHILVVLPPGADKSEVVSQALRNQGAVPWAHDEFSTTGLVWDQFSDSSSNNDFVTQYYNSNNDPTGNGGSALSNTYNSWNGVSTSIFEFSDGGPTDRCPSLVRECKGSQYYDGYNDVAWLELRGCCTLGVTWFSTSIDEADVALNTKFSWDTTGNKYDVQTVFLHENGHVIGLGHSEVKQAVMYASYQEVRQILHQDDKDGITSLYHAGTTNTSPTLVSISISPVNPSITEGSTQQFTATGTYSDDTNQVLTDVTWLSSDPNVATIDNVGLATGMQVSIDSIVTITATSGGQEDTTILEVTDAPEEPTTGTSTKMHVHDISFNTEVKGKSGNANLYIVVTIQDSNHAGGVEGATVQLKLTGTDGTNASGSGPTNSNGVITFKYNQATVGQTYTAEVVNVSKDGSTYDSTLDEETSDSVTI